MTQSLKQGETIEPISHGPIDLDTLKLYAKASGDFNPIHTDEVTAKKAGLPGVIAHGMLSAAYLADRAMRFMKPWEGEWKLSSFQTRFRAMIFLGDTIRIVGSVKSVSDESICLELSATNGKGEVATQAYAEFRRSSLETR